MAIFKTCRICGATFPADRTTRRYCGDACRQRAARDRKGARPRFTQQALRERRRGNR